VKSEGRREGKPAGHHYTSGPVPDTLFRIFQVLQVHNRDNRKPGLK